MAIESSCDIICSRMAVRDGAMDGGCISDGRSWERLRCTTRHDSLESRSFNSGSSGKSNLKDHVPSRRMRGRLGSWRRYHFETGIRLEKGTWRLRLKIQSHEMHRTKFKHVCKNHQRENRKGFTAVELRDRQARCLLTANVRRIDRKALEVSWRLSERQ
jgi:hypothetical protein